MEFLYIYLVLFAYFMVWFIIAQIKKNNGLIDIAWGASFVVTAISSFVLSGEFNFTKLIMLQVVILWGMRLSLYLFKRNWNKEEDFRYQAMRKAWKTNVKLKAFFKVFVAQSLFSYVISLPIIFTNLYSTPLTNLIQVVVLVVGVVIFLIGFIFEVLADFQLNEFKKDPRSEEHTSELQSRENIVCRLLLEKKN